MNPDLERQCWDYINSNMFTIVPMDEATFRNRAWTSVEQVGPTLSGDVYLVGIHGNDGCRGYWDPQRQGGAVSPGL
jgi:hypothetical protein